MTVPLRAYRDVPVEPLAGKIVLDTNNYYWERDGHIDVLDRGEATTSGLLQEHLPTSKVVKAFNHIGARTSPPTELRPARRTGVPWPRPAIIPMRWSSSPTSTTGSASTR